MSKLLDPKIASIFINEPEDSEKVGKFMDSYIGRLEELYSKAATEYLISKGIAQEKIDELDKLGFEYDGEDEILINADELLHSEEFETILKQKVDNYSDLVYDKFAVNLTNEQRDEINNHIHQVQDEINKEIENFKQMALGELASLREEYEQKMKEVPPASVPVDSASSAPVPDIAMPSVDMPQVPPVAEQAPVEPVAEELPKIDDQAAQIPAGSGMEESNVEALLHKDSPVPVKIEELTEHPNVAPGNLNEAQTLDQFEKDLNVAGTPSVEPEIIPAKLEVDVPPQSETAAPTEPVPAQPTPVQFDLTDKMATPVFPPAAVETPNSSDNLPQ